LTRRPSAALAPFVDFYWLQEGPTPSHARELVLPTGTMELVIGLAAPPLRLFDAAGSEQASAVAVVCGARSEPFVVDTAAQTAVIGVHFEAGGAAPRLGVSAADFAETHAALTDLWGGRTEELHERLATERTSARRFALLERALEALLRERTALHPVVSLGLEVLGARDPRATVASATARAVSSRHFISLFRVSGGSHDRRSPRSRRARGTPRPRRPLGHTGHDRGGRDGGHAPARGLQRVPARRDALLRAHSLGVPSRRRRAALYLVEGLVDVTLLTDAGPVEATLRPGSVCVVPRGLWHRQHAREPAALLFATAASTTGVSWADDPRMES
jgi:hypothetical protein